MKKLFTVLIFIGFCKVVHAQQNDSALINKLLHKISAEQVSADGEFYKGMFPSFRECGGAPHNYSPDTNIFFTAIGAFTLRNMLPQLTGENKVIADKIITEAKSTFPYYKNKKGHPFYNFWPTDGKIMPHAYIFQYLKAVFGQGEDADDAVMVLMAENADDSTCNVLKKRIIATSNLSRMKIISTFKRYRNIPAYSTYLGYRMPPDFDFCVQTNLLYFMFDRNLPLVKQDSATIHLLAEMTRNREYKRNPIFISPYYVKSSVLLYHISRLMGRFTIPELEQYKPQLIADIQEELNNSNGVMDKIILNTSLLRLGANPPQMEIENVEAFEKSNQNNFIFFQARAAFSYPLPFKQIFLNVSYLTYYFYAPAYNKILLLEYLLERNKGLN